LLNESRKCEGHWDDLQRVDCIEESQPSLHSQSSQLFHTSKGNENRISPRISWRWWSPRVHANKKDTQWEGSLETLQLVILSYFLLPQGEHNPSGFEAREHYVCG